MTNGDAFSAASSQSAPGADAPSPSAAPGAAIFVSPLDLPAAVLAVHEAGQALAWWTAGLGLLSMRGAQNWHIRLAFLYLGRSNEP